MTKTVAIRKQPGYSVEAVYVVIDPDTGRELARRLDLFLAKRFAMERGWRVISEPKEAAK